MILVDPSFKQIVHVATDTPEHREENRGCRHLHLLEIAWDSCMLSCGSIAGIIAQV